MHYCFIKEVFETILYRGSERFNCNSFNDGLNLLCLLNNYLNVFEGEVYQNCSKNWLVEIWIKY